MGARTRAAAIGHVARFPAPLPERVRRDVAEQRRRWRYRIHRGRVWFDQEVRAAHRRLRQSLPAYLRDANYLSLVTAPVIYSLLVPFALLDLSVTLYQRVCFPIYGVAAVRRRRYFRFDRRRLEYLNAIERANCTFCTYANGVIAYVREVAARTEQYWCPIRHAQAVPTPHARYRAFFDYGDALGYHRGLAVQRRRLAPPPPRPATRRRPRSPRSR